ncbi:hypothetical protein Tco_1465674 [Tanacetum coccineum]
MKSPRLDVKTTSADTTSKFLSGFQSSIFLEISNDTCAENIEGQDRESSLNVEFRYGKIKSQQIFSVAVQGLLSNPIGEKCARVRLSGWQRLQLLNFKPKKNHIKHVGKRFPIEEAHTHLCTTDQRASECTALRASVVNIRTLFLRIKTHVLSSCVVGLSKSLRALAQSLAKNCIGHQLEVKAERMADADKNLQLLNEHERQKQLLTPFTCVQDEDDFRIMMTFTKQLMYRPFADKRSWGSAREKALEAIIEAFDSNLPHEFVEEK